jgi:hypothetical protein
MLLLVDYLWMVYDDNDNNGDNEDNIRVLYVLEDNWES